MAPDPWVKVWWSWYASRSHLELSFDALHLGGYLLSLAKASPEPPWVLAPDGSPMSPEKLVQSAHAHGPSPARMEAVLRDVAASKDLPAELRLRVLEVLAENSGAERIERALAELVEVGTMVRRDEDGAVGFTRSGWTKYQDQAFGVRQRVAKHREKQKGGQRHPAVYFLRSEATQAVKIGWSSAVARRIIEIRRGLLPGDDRVTLLGTMTGGADVEMALHKRFASERIDNTEWFRPSADLLAYIAKHTSGNSGQRSEIRDQRSEERDQKERDARAPDVAPTLVTFAEQLADVWDSVTREARFEPADRGQMSSSHFLSKLGERIAVDVRRRELPWWEATFHRAAAAMFLRKKRPATTLAWFVSAERNLQRLEAGDFDRDFAAEDAEARTRGKGASTSRPPSASSPRHPTNCGCRTCKPELHSRGGGAT